MGTLMYPHVQGRACGMTMGGGLDGCSRDPSATTAGAVCMIAMLSTGRPAVAVAAAAERDARSQRSEAERIAQGVPCAVCL